MKMMKMMKIMIMMKMMKLLKLMKNLKRAAHSICNLRHKVPKNIPIVIHNFGYATHFMIKKLAE